MDLKDEFYIQTGGTLLAMRVLISAMLKNHTDPKAHLAAIRSVLAQYAAFDGQLPAPIQAAFDEGMQEMTSHLTTRINQSGGQT